MFYIDEILNYLVVCVKCHTLYKMFRKASCLNYTTYSLRFLINVLYCVRVGMRQSSNKFFFFPEKLKGIYPPLPCWGSWGENFPSTTGKLINKAGVKKLLLWVVFTPWWETPTRSVILPQSVAFTHREEAGCAFFAPYPQTLTHFHQWALTHGVRAHIPTCTSFFSTAWRRPDSSASIPPSLSRGGCDRDRGLNRERLRGEL